MAGYIGRFAPTPSGPLHFGSLLTAVASYLDARANNGIWKLRIDDLDTPRVIEGAIDEILHTLDVHGLAWDGDVVFQSDHVSRHQAALATLENQSLCFYCTCSRKALRGHDVYPGTCRDTTTRPVAEAAIRVRAPLTEYAFNDGLQGQYAQRLADSVGDFIVLRRDRFAAYQLAVVVDDDAMAITDIVRGADLLHNTPRQLFLIERLGLPAPRYLHVPVIAEQNGVKLSKHTSATAVDNRFASQNLRSMLDLLGQEPPNMRAVDALLAWAVEAWQRDALPRAQSLNNFVSL